MSTTLSHLIETAILEDMPKGDITTESMALESRFGSARLIAKEDLVLSGRLAFEETVLLLEPQAELKWAFDDGQLVLKGQVVCLLRGDLIQLLKAERVALNFLGHLSGVASLTRLFVEKIKHTSTRILDTRKTLPGYRELEKKAVRDGGGMNHRMNLSDQILVKDNHIRAAGSLKNAVQRIRQNCALPIEVEARTMEEVEESVQLKVHRILLDNMNNSQLKEALTQIPASIETEASGNMSIDRVASVAELGVHFISVGALTHSATTSDLSLMFDWTGVK